MKHRNSTEKEDVLTIWIGQLLIFALKADAHDLVLLQNVFNSRLKSLLETNDLVTSNNLVCRATEKLCYLVGKRFAWQQEAIDLLASKTKSFTVNFVACNDYSGALNNLRVVNAWSGLSSCLSTNLPMPLSLLDYLLEIILPVLAGGMIADLCNGIDSLFLDATGEYDTDLIEDELETIVKRICFNSCLERPAMRELSLAVLMHLPKTNKDFSLKTGFLYKILQEKFAHMEEK